MKLREFYQKAIATGIENDPRGKEATLRDIEVRKKHFNSLSEDEKDLFDTESLNNPYSDSRILNGTGEEDIRSILVGIDLLMSHHPGGRAYATLYEVMRIQSDILHRFGVPINVAEDLMDGRIKEVERKLMPVNHTRAVDAARLLGVPLVCLHTPSDNMVATYLQKTFDEKKPHTLTEVMNILKTLPEYREAAHNG